jgi:hypothetical protein
MNHKNNKYHKETSGSSTNQNSQTSLNGEKTKMVICKNYLKNGKCQFNNVCKYAHGIKEQQLTSARKKVYDLIETVKTSSFRVNNEFLFLHDSIEDELLILTKLCSGCQDGTCYGGINCKKGAYNMNYLICKNNFVYLNCKNVDCPMIHLRSDNDANDVNRSTIDTQSNTDTLSGKSSNSDNYDTDNVNGISSDSDQEDLCSKYDKYFCQSEPLLTSDDDDNDNDNYYCFNNAKLGNNSVNDGFCVSSSSGGGGSSNSSTGTDSSFFDSDELSYLEETDSSDDEYASIFDSG